MGRTLSLIINKYHQKGKGKAFIDRLHGLALLQQYLSPEKQKKRAARFLCFQ